MVYTKKNNMNVIISAKTYKIECINETIEKTIKNNKIYVLLLEYIKFIIFESFLKLSGIARYNIIPFVIATKSRNPIIPLAHISKPTSLTSLLTEFLHLHFYIIVSDHNGPFNRSFLSSTICFNASSDGVGINFCRLFSSLYLLFC